MLKWLIGLAWAYACWCLARWILRDEDRDQWT